MNISKSKRFRSSRSLALMEVHQAALSSEKTSRDTVALIENCFKNGKFLKDSLGDAIRKALILKISKASIIKALSTKPNEPVAELIRKIPSGTMASKGRQSTIQKNDSRTKMHSLKSRVYAIFVSGGSASSK